MAPERSASSSFIVILRYILSPKLPIAERLNGPERSELLDQVSSVGNSISSRNGFGICTWDKCNLTDCISVPSCFNTTGQVYPSAVEGFSVWLTILSSSAPLLSRVTSLTPKAATEIVISSMLLFKPFISSFTSRILESTSTVSLIS